MLKMEKIKQSNKNKERAIHLNMKYKLDLQSLDSDSGDDEEDYSTVEEDSFDDDLSSVDESDSSEEHSDETSSEEDVEMENKTEDL